MYGMAASMSTRILVVDDEEDILELAEYNLAKEGFDVSVARSGEEALKKIASGKPDLVVLDLMLPGVDGYEVARRIKRNPETDGIPIVMLTAKGGESDIVAGLELGAEDYVVKPFSPRVLVARIRTVLRRNAQKPEADGSMIRVRDLVIDPSRFEVRVDGSPVDLTATEFHLLEFMARRPGWVFTRSRIIDSVKGSDYPVTDRSVDVQIVGLRKKLKAAGAVSSIETVRGIGYRFKE
jgi:two-component system, OmpR family, alkaline phosphatase synthesis response regulator PhoP